jgi:O-antigen/teichoic acid export membrane protein
MLRWYNVTFFFSGILVIFNAIEQANFQYKGVFASGLVRAAILFLFLLINYIFRFTTDLLVLVHVQVVCVIAAISISYFYVRKYLTYSYVFKWEWVWKIFHYGKFSFATTLSSQLSGTLDQWMLSGIINPVASAAFNIAVRITNLVDIPTNAIATIVFPQSAKRIETEGKDAVKYLYEKSVGTILAIVLPALLFLYVFNSYIIAILAGDKYEDSVPILNITLLYCILAPFGRQTGGYSGFYRKNRNYFYDGYLEYGTDTGAKLLLYTPVCGHGSCVRYVDKPRYRLYHRANCFIQTFEGECIKRFCVCF